MLITHYVLFIRRNTYLTIASHFVKKTNGGKKEIHHVMSGICFKCCGPTKHRAKNCKSDVRCSICNSRSHDIALYADVENHEGEVNNKEKSPVQSKKQPQTSQNDNELNGTEINSNCTQICGKPDVTSKSCAKIIPVKIFHRDTPEKHSIVYAIIDDQSSHSLATSTLFDNFHISEPYLEYTLVSLACIGCDIS